MTEWAVPQQGKLKYTQLFNLHDRNRSGFLSGLQCRDILLQSGLPRNILAEIWNLSDIDGDGQLTREEFILAMHLTNQVRAGHALPTELPIDLIPPSYRKSRSVSTTSVHSTSSVASSMSGAINDDRVSQKSLGGNQTATVPVATSVLNSNTFEDKRRENFERGRAELERRRLKIIEQQSSILNEQLVACKKQVAEAKAKIDSMRSGRDTKAGLLTSLEAQLKTVRDRKAYLDREERSLIAMAKDLNLVNSTQSAELDQIAITAKQENIRQMKEKLVQLQNEKEVKSNELNEATKRLEASRKDLEQVFGEVKKNSVSYNEMITRAKTMRQQIMEEYKNKTVDLDSVWDSTPNFATNNNQLFSKDSDEPKATVHASSEDPWAAGPTVAPKSSDDPFSFNATPASSAAGTAASAKTKTSSQDNGGFEPARDYSALSGFESNSGPNGRTDEKPFNNLDDQTGDIPEASRTRKRYRALYAFEARNLDELTINPGDIIAGCDDVCEPGWLMGELSGQRGLFPEAYVEPLPVAAETATAGDDDEIAKKVPPAAMPNQMMGVESKLDEITPASSEASTANAGTSVPRYRVVYAFDARNPDELTINPGDIIVGVQGPHEPGWLMGELDGQKGLFPEAYVERMADVVQADPMTEQATGTLRRGSSSGSLRSKKSRAKKAEVATVIANYRALGQEQLNLEKGQLVLVRRKMDSGWWEGELQIKGKKKQVGWFPSSYVKLL